MAIEPNHGLEFGQEIFMTVRKDGELVAIELENGTLERWLTEKSSREGSLRVFGADKPAVQEKKV